MQKQKPFYGKLACMYHVKLLPVVNDFLFLPNKRKENFKMIFINL